MTVETRVNVTVSADGKGASDALQKLNRDLSDTKVKQLDAAQAAAKLKTEYKNLDQSAAGAAAKVAELRNKLVGAIAEEQEAARAAAAATRAYDEYARSLGKVANSAGQMRAATVNLGQQIGDVSQGLAAGINPATIFAQQAGQVSFALSGMGGALGRVGAFLGGPWGIALTAGLVVLSPLVAKLFEGEKASNAAAEATKRQKQALEEFDQLVKRTIETQDAMIKRQGEEAAKRLGLAEATRAQTRALLELEKAKLAGEVARMNDPTNATEFGNPAAQAAGIRSGRIAEIEKALADLATQTSTDQARVRAAGALASREKIREATDKAAAANGRFARTEAELFEKRSKNLITEKQYEDGYRKALEQKEAALNSIKDATKAEAVALRDAKREAKELADAMERLQSLPGRNSQLIAGLGGAAAVAALAGRPIGGTSAERIAASEQASRESGLDGVVEGAAARVAEAKRLGEEQARSFYQKATRAAQEVGDLIGTAFGARAGAVVSGIGQLGFGTKNSKGITSDLTGIGSQLTTALTGVFGNRAQGFADKVGAAAGGAATGSVISGIGDALGIKNSKTGAQIGGALGGIASSFGIPGGEIIGSILGGLVGNLFAKKGSTTISATDGKISQTGSGNASIQKATGALGNTLTDALQAIADQLGGEIGTFAVSIGKRGDRFRVDRSGTGKINGKTVTGTGTESEALALAIADAIRDGGVVTRSPRVQAVLQQYADNINKAVAEALKVKSLEDLISDRQNPFASAFRQLEDQLKQRVSIAEQYGFDLVEIERINGEDRAAVLKDTLANATGSIKNLLNDLQFGSRATGSPTERLAGLTAERDRLTALARGGDDSQLDAIASIIQQIDDLQKETFGKTQGFASGRADSVALLNDLVKTTEDRIKAAADAARAGTETTNNKLTEANATLEDIYRANLQTNQGIDGLTAAMQAIIAGRVLGGGNLNSQFVRLN
jgi:hypothetical protein